MEASKDIVVLFMKKNRLQHKTRDVFLRYLATKGVDRTQEAELQKALVAFRRVLNADAVKKYKEVHGRSRDISYSRTRKHLTNKANRELWNERQRLRYADTAMAKATTEARTRSKKEEAQAIGAHIVVATQEVVKNLAQTAIKASLNRCGSNWPCYVIVVKDFIQQIHRCQPGLRLLDDMRTFFKVLGDCAGKTDGVHGEKGRTFKQLDFDPDTFALPSVVNKHLSDEKLRLSIKRFFTTFNTVLRSFLEALLDCCKEVKNVKWMDSLKDSLTNILGPVNFKRLASFILRYTLNGPSISDDNEKGLSVHVDHDVFPVGSILLGGSHVSENKPCIAIYPTHSTIFGPELQPLEISYSKGDLVLFDGSFAHGSMIATPDRQFYSQFLATNQEMKMKKQKKD